MDRKHIVWMSGTFVLGLVVGVLMSRVLPLRGNVSASGVIDLYPPKVDAYTPYVAKIDDYVITEDTFRVAYEQFMLNSPANYREQLGSSDPRSAVLGEMVSSVVTLLQALKEGILEDPEYKDMLELAIRNIVVQAFLQKNAPDDNIFEPTEAEMNQAFNAWGRQMLAQGMSMADARRELTNAVVGQKRQQWAQQFAQQVKEQYRVERNMSVLSNISLDSK